MDAPENADSLDLSSWMAACAAAALNRGAAAEALSTALPLGFFGESTFCAIQPEPALRLEFIRKACEAHLRASFGRPGLSLRWEPIAKPGMIPIGPSASEVENARLASQEALKWSAHGQSAAGRALEAMGATLSRKTFKAS